MTGMSIGVNGQAIFKEVLAGQNGRAGLTVHPGREGFTLVQEKMDTC